MAKVCLGKYKKRHKAQKCAKAATRRCKGSYGVKQHKGKRKGFRRKKTYTVKKL
jgi:hypothetical protein